MNAEAPVSGQQLRKKASETAEAVDAAAIAHLARDCSIEINYHDLKDLEASRQLLPAGKKVYVSCLPKQTWDESTAACRALTQAGFRAVPNIPVRLIPDARTLESLIATLVEHAGVEEVLLISGDYPAAVGPYSNVADALRTGFVGKHGMRRVSLGGHPEGHPHVPLAEIRRAEREKALLARDLGLHATLVTQFFFEPEPFLDWVEELRAAGVRARIAGGVAGPARITTLFKYAMRCGAGPSIRALGARPSAAMKLVGVHGPQTLMRSLARARTRDAADFDGLHFFCFGGYLRTCEWLHRVAQGQFTLTETGGFQT